MRNRIFFKLLAAFVLVIVAGTVTLDISIRRSWEDSLREITASNLRDKAAMFANRVNHDRSASLQEIASQEAQAAGARATIIDSSGQALADSEVAPDSLKNLAREPEFAAALRGQAGMDQRRSESLGVPYLYAAAPISGGAVRLAYPLSNVSAGMAGSRNTLLLGSWIAFLAALLIAGVAAQLTASRLRTIVQFSERIAAGDLAARISERSGDEIGQLAAALDKTARQLEKNFAALQTSQRELETLLNSMEDAVIAIGEDNRVQWANRRMDHLQHTRLSAPVVETVRDPDFLRIIRSANESRQVVTGRAGSIVPGRIFDVTAAPMPRGGAVAVLRDLTETERMEKTRRDFIANVSHELRTPLTSIQGYAETLLDSNSERNHSREFLEIIRKNASRMSRLTEDLLTLARVESGEHQFDVEPTSPLELLNEAVESFQENARAQGIELQVENSTEAPVDADREAIHQVFSNLIDNAIKYAASGGRVVLGAQPSEYGVQFYVRDFGAGIPSEHLPRLFERFYRVDKARSRESGGTGLGLAIAKHIVFAHGGTIRAESELNHGSVFYFTLPFAIDVDPAKGSRESVPEFTEL
ncbi:MAG: HAMP domain-containing protein [Acidobacteriaceae bacterium]|nr:HAMP domain-containing protein [Acidobacteriaceae bacterium]